MVDRWASWTERKEAKEVHDNNFRKGIIGRATYILSLEIMGFRAREAKDEADYIEGMK